MIRVAIIDDELPALKMAESVIRELDGVSIAGMFSDQDELLERIPMIEADLLLLDIKMPGMHGLELAEHILELRSDLFIVFVTAYDSYAVDAFETDALDYIMKPITAERMKKTLDRYIKRRELKKEGQLSPQIKVFAFGRFSIENENGDKLRFRTAKTEELMAFLLHHKGRALTKERIMEELWYDRELYKAQAMLYTTLYQLRKDLENFGLVDIIRSNRKDGGSCHVAWNPDFWDYLEFVEILDRQRENSLTDRDKKYFTLLYRTGYYEENGWRWALEKQAELEFEFEKHMELFIGEELKAESYETALLYLKRLAELLPYNESIHIRIIAIHLLLNHREVAFTYYRKTQAAFAEEAEDSFELDMDQLVREPLSAFSLKRTI